MKNFQKLAPLDTSLDVELDKVESRPSLSKKGLQRSRSMFVEEQAPYNTLTEEDRALYESFVENGVPVVEDELTSGDVLENELVVNTPPDITIKHVDFLHLQEGVLGVFYQNEHHAKHIIDKVNDLGIKDDEILRRLALLEENISKLAAVVDGFHGALRVIAGKIVKK